MKYLKLFENFQSDQLSEEDYKNLIDRYKIWHNTSKEEATKIIDKFIKTPFDDSFIGISNLPESIKLYRLVFVEENLDEDFLGFSWTINKENLYSLNFLESIGILEVMNLYDIDDLKKSDDIKKLKILVGDFKKSDIDFYFTILNWIQNPLEKEISVKSNPISWSIEEYNLENLKDFIYKIPLLLYSLKLNNKFILLKNLPKGGKIINKNSYKIDKMGFLNKNISIL